MQSSIITSIIVTQLASNSLQCEGIVSSILLTDVIMFGRHYQQQSSYPVNFSAGKPSTILPSPAGIPQQHFSHPRVPSILFPLPRVTLTFCSLNRGKTAGKFLCRSLVRNVHRWLTYIPAVTSISLHSVVNGFLQ